MHLRRRDTRDTIRENKRREINKKKKNEEKEMKKEEEVFIECKKVYASNCRIYMYTYICIYILFEQDRETKLMGNSINIGNCGRAS